MLHKEFWGLLFLGFVFWVIAASSPSARIENICRPVGWTGNIITSLSALVLPAQQATIQGGFDKFEYGCRYTVWRLFYQEDYNKWLATQGKAPVEVKPATAASGAASSASTAKPASAGAGAK